jgi:hypothetical protein
MINRTVLMVFTLTAMALPAVSMSADEPITKSQSHEVTATVVAVDQATRLVTLKGKDGETFDVQAGKGVEHLDKVQPGDVVRATYTESLAFDVVDKNEKPAGVSETVKKDIGSREVGRVVTSSFKINAYDQNTHVLWVTTDKGQTRKITIEDPKAQAKLKTLSPGNVVKVTYTESLALKLEKVAPK